MIPDQAVQAAAETFAHATGNDWHQVSAPDQEIHLQEARAALEAALPHLEAALRKQIATDIRATSFYFAEADTPGNAAFETLMRAARIAEEGNTK